MVFDSEKYTHEADRAALKALRAVPGFPALLKAFMSVWSERQQRILNMSSRIRIDERQMRKYYDMLPPICGKLGIPVPELYLEMNVVPNAYTGGDTDPFIVITSGLLKTVPEELIPTVLAHECGHIACHHVLYLTMGRMVLRGAGNALGSMMPLGNLLTVPLQVAFYYWMRCSEFSADRAAVLCDGTGRKMQEVCMRMAGWDKDIDAEVSLDAFLGQTADYRELIGGSKWNKALEFLILSQSSHPLMAVRAAECGNWFGSEGYQAVVSPRIAPADGSVRALTSCRELPDAAPDSIVIPEEYRRLPPKPADPEGSKAYGHVSTQCDAFILVSAAEQGETGPAELQAVSVEEIRSGLTEDEGLIAVDCGETAHGRKYSYSIVKARQRPRGTEYKATVRLGTQDGTVSVRAYFSETGSPGYREATVKGRISRELQAAGAAGTEPEWYGDPYDRTCTGGFLMNESEKEKYDIRFPLHPLTEARRFVTALIGLN